MLLSILIGTPLDDGHQKKTSGVLHSVICPLADDFKRAGTHVRLFLGHKLKGKKACVRYIFEMIIKVELASFEKDKAPLSHNRKRTVDSCFPGLLA
jgi:hypothetical protein